MDELQKQVQRMIEAKSDPRTLALDAVHRMAEIIPFFPTAELAQERIATIVLNIAKQDPDRIRMLRDLAIVTLERWQGIPCIISLADHPTWNDAELIAIYKRKDGDA
jgi:hypothetical protein